MYTLLCETLSVRSPSRPMPRISRPLCQPVKLLLAPAPALRPTGALA